MYPRREIDIIEESRPIANQEKFGYSHTWKMNDAREQENKQTNGGTLLARKDMSVRKTPGDV